MKEGRFAVQTVKDYIIKAVDLFGRRYRKSDERLSDFYNICFCLGITSETGDIKNENGIVALELDMEEYTFSNIAVDHIYRDITVHKGMLAKNEEKQEVRDMINLVKINRIRQEREMDVVPQSLHC